MAAETILEMLILSSAFLVHVNARVDTMIAGLPRVHDEAFKCEQNSKTATKMAAKIVLLC